MKLLFLNPTNVRFSVETPEWTALGGTESSAAWLARHLAARGHDVTLMAELPPGTPERVQDVRHVPADAGTGAFFREQDFEAIITLTSPHNAQSLKQAAPRALQIAWLHLLASQPDMKSLPAAAPFIDCAVMVSHYQRDALGFAGPSQVIGNGIAPAFENMFASAAELQAAKENRAVYTSIPDRGLDWLVESFPQAGVETRLDVYSGMRIYQRPDGELGALYARINAMPHCRRHDAIGQRALADAIRSAAFLTYPGNIPETYCIVALEAIAAGLKVVALAMGALPETTLGFADLMPLNGVHGEQVPGLFAAHIRRNVEDFLARPQAWAEERFAQSREVGRRCSWTMRAKEWEAFLAPAIAWKRNTT
jgi:glycosyltransferase involved in cell wall biosynthesis